MNTILKNNIELHANVPLTLTMQEKVIEEFSEKLNKFSDLILDIKVSLLVENDTHKVEVLTITKNKKESKLKKVSASGEDMYNVISIVADKTARQIRKHKEQLTKHKSIKSMDDLDIQINVPEVRNVKTFNVKPMFLEDAILKMNELRHKFFLFQDAETSAPSLLYIRKDESYGIIKSNFNFWNNENVKEEDLKTYVEKSKEYNVQKIKIFDITPLSVNEAIEKMNYLKHDFFFYFDKEEEVPCVLYLRKDNHYGIIESEF